MVFFRVRRSEVAMRPGRRRSSRRSGPAGLRSDGPGAPGTPPPRGGTACPPPLAAFWALSTRRVTISASARMSSRLMMSMSRRDLWSPPHGSHWDRRSSGPRGQWRRWCGCWRGNLLPKPSPLEAPFTSPRDVHKLNDCRGELLGLMHLPPSHSSRSSGQKPPPRWGRWCKRRSYPPEPRRW